MSDFIYPIDFKYGDVVWVSFLGNNSDEKFYGVEQIKGVVLGYKENVAMYYTSYFVSIGHNDLSTIVECKKDRLELIK